MVEALGLVMLLASLGGRVSSTATFAILFFALAVGIGLVLSVATLLLDQASFMRYRIPARPAVAGVVEPWSRTSATGR